VELGKKKKEEEAADQWNWKHQEEETLARKSSSRIFLCVRKADPGFVSDG
jgi:hypothetical protein